MKIPSLPLPSSPPRFSARVYLFLAVTIFAAANSVTRKVMDIGEHNLIDGRNPISFCNVLFVGNLCALIPLIFIYGRQWNPQVLRRLSWRDWLGLTSVAILSGALAPALIFSALDATQVNNVVLIGRIEPPLGLALSVFFLKARVNRWVVAGAVVSFIGVMLTIILQPPVGNMTKMAGFHIGTGELLALFGSISAAVATVISKAQLSNIPLGIFAIFRTILGTIVFFTIALNLFGPMHFIDVFSPLLWRWMLLYGAVIVVGGQLCWLIGLKRSNAAEISLASSFSPIAGVIAAYFILMEAPTSAQLLGGSVLLGGIVLNQIGVKVESSRNRLGSARNLEKEMDIEVGFKGL